LKRVSKVVKVRVEDVVVYPVRPKVGQIVYQYAIIARDQYGHAKTFFVDADKYDKAKVEDAIKEHFSGRYGIKRQDVEVEWLVEPPKVVAGK